MDFPRPLLPFIHPEVLQTALPLGGLGAGCVCLNGYGGLQDFSIHNRPALSAMPDRHNTRETAFALLHIRGTKPVTRLLEGAMPPGKLYDQGLQAQGFRHGGYEGLPRFHQSGFRSGYPFGQIALTDPAVPLAVEITGWSPFVPLDDVASGLPCAIVEYAFRNTSRRTVEFEFSYHLSHLALPADGSGTGTRNRVMRGGKGIFFDNTLAPDSEAFGSASLSVGGAVRPKVKAMWLRGGWFDAVSALWREVESGKFQPNDGKADEGQTGRNGGSVLVRGSLAPGEQTVVPMVLTWYFPNSKQQYGRATVPSGCCDTEADPPTWRPFYAGRFADAAAVAEHVHRHYESLRARTLAFQKALLSTTAPREVLDAVSANLAILKSPTVLRQENGHVWGWEGCFVDAGCCHGSCTHVWNYAQALPHLFPALERTLREQELVRSMDERGHVNFRAALPDGPTPHNHHAAADGQLGGLMKLFRDWQISGDTPWLARLYPAARRSLEYCIATWDPERKGVLAEPHHNTYDIEFWGPDGMCMSLYVGALCATAALARALGHAPDAAVYTALAARAARFMEEELFNGEYFEQRVQWQGLRDTSFARLIADQGKGKVKGQDKGKDAGKAPSGESQEMRRLLKQEGPKYQYGRGCLSDGIIGAWMAGLYGLDLPLDRAKVVKSLRAIHRHNFRASLDTHANCQRPGYALGAEPGLLLCSWPRGGKPTLPFVYSDEVWTGIEYQVAAHLLAEGQVKAGLEIVRAVRSRYDGRVRNPWNEYECGSFYARAMASYALLSAWSGFRYSAVERTLWFGPVAGAGETSATGAQGRQAKGGAFQTFFAAASGYGTIRLDDKALTVRVLAGELCLERVVVRRAGRTLDLAVDLTARPDAPARVALPKQPERPERPEQPKQPEQPERPKRLKPLATKKAIKTN